MIDLDITFDTPDWAAYLEDAAENVSAMTMLALLEEAEEAEFEDAFEELEQRNLAIDLSDLPRATAVGEASVRLRREMQLVKQGLKPELLEEGDPLRLYLEELAMTPVCGDEQLLAEKCAAGDERAMEQLTNLSLGRVITIAAEHTGMGVLLMDLIQEGSLGLWQAVSGYEKGEFSAQAEKKIRFAMAKAVLTQARQSGVGQKMRTALEDYRSVDERLLSELGRNPTVEEIAEYLHVSPEAAASIGKMLENARRLQQAKRVPEEEEEEKEAQEQAVEDTAYFQSRQRVNEMLSGLTEQEQMLINLRFGLEGGMPLSPEDSGRKLGLTPAEVVAMEAAALAKMRKQ